MAEGYARFCEKSLGKVPLEGMQANQMLRVRPTAEGRLEPVTGFETWSFSIEPGRGISDHEKRTRDEKIARWVNNVPPEPEWERLELNYLVQDDLPAEPERDDPIFAIEMRSLELTDHQKTMLETPEERMAKMVFPMSIRDRASIQRKRKRKNKWAEKFRGVFQGKASQKWASRVRSGEDLSAEAKGTARARPRLAASADAASKKKTTAGKFLEKAKKVHEKGKKRSEVWRRDNDKRRGKDTTDPCEDSPWHDRALRVLKEGDYEGLKGVVTCVSKYKTEPTEPEKYRLQLLSDFEKGKEGKGKMMLLDSDEVILEDESWAEPKPLHIDYRSSEIKSRRLELADKLAIGLVEKVAFGTLLELGSVTAAMTEVAERVGLPENTILIEPTIAVAWARDGIEPAAPSEEDEAFVAKVRTSSHLHIIVHSEAPKHYTYVHVELKDEVLHNVDYKDSLRDPSPSAARQVEKILCNLGVASPSWKCPPRANRGYQVGGWECGLWATRYLEQALRAARNEGRTPPATVKEQAARLNKFIENLKAARAQEAEKAASEVKKAEAKARAKAKASARAAEALAKRVEPTFATLEEALEAAQECKKCLPTKACTKGCRTCMGEWFEHIRQRDPTRERRQPVSLEELEENEFGF